MCCLLLAALIILGFWLTVASELRSKLVIWVKIHKTS